MFVFRSEFQEGCICLGMRNNGELYIDLYSRKVYRQNERKLWDVVAR